MFGTSKSCLDKRFLQDFEAFQTEMKHALYRLREKEKEHDMSLLCYVSLYALQYSCIRRVVVDPHLYGESALKKT